MKRRSHLNWYVLFACFLAFAIGGTLCAIGAFILAGNPMVHMAAPMIGLALSLGLFAASACALHEMESC